MAEHRDGLRFVLVSTFYPPYHFGGDAIQAHRLAEALARRGHEVHVIHSRDAYHLAHPGEPPVDFEHHANIHCHGLLSRSHLGTALLAHQLGTPGPYRGRMRELLESLDPHVIHFHNVSLMGGPGVLGLEFNGVETPIRLYTAHEYWWVCPTHVLYRFGREACTRRTCLACTLHNRRPPQLWRFTGAVPRALRHLDRLLLPSRFALERHQHLEVPKTVLPHFVPIPEETPARNTAAQPYVLFVGRLEPLKGLADILPFFTEDLGAELRVVGTGSQEEALRREVSTKGLRVRFLGPLHPEALAEHYRDAIALVAPSRCYETFGMTVAEAFAQGTPAIARGHGALAELIEDSGAGYAFDSSEECRHALRQLLDDPELRGRLGEDGRRAARERYSEEAHMTNYLELVHTLRQEKTSQ